MIIPEAEMLSFTGKRLGPNDERRIEFRQTKTCNAFIFENPDHHYPKKVWNQLLGADNGKTITCKELDLAPGDLKAI